MLQLQEERKQLPVGKQKELFAGEVNTAITPQLKLSENDTLAVVGRTEDINKFEAYLHERD